MFNLRGGFYVSVSFLQICFLSRESREKLLPLETQQHFAKDGCRTVYHHRRFGFTYLQHTCRNVIQARERILKHIYVVLSTE